MYLFFIRHFNDIDHMTPIIWKMARNNYPVSVYCIEPARDIKNDYRLKFLTMNGVKIDYVFNHFAQGLGLRHWIHRFFFLRLLALHRSILSNKKIQGFHFIDKFNQSIQKYGDRLYKRSIKRFYNLEWAKGIVKKSSAKVICFDWVRSRKSRVVGPLIRAANEMSIPIISLPHGVFLYTNNFIKFDSTEKMRFEKFNLFDYVVVQNPLRKKVIAKSGVDDQKIVVLGSTRYCDEWMAQNRKILPRKMLPQEVIDKKLKVVFMTTRPSYRINVDRMMQTFEMLSQMEDFEVVIKPHTRSGDEAFIYRDVPLSDVSDLSSVELCEWADVILVIASSIIIEALKLGKPALYLKHLHENTMEYEKFNACWIINSDELKDALSSLRKDKNNLPYTEENVNRWLAEIIYGGRNKRDILNDYTQFIVSGGQYRISS
jgi:UDP-N-acetylglucosamine:LPS N-acetylglucosamine transferase